MIVVFLRVFLEVVRKSKLKEITKAENAKLKSREAYDKQKKAETWAWARERDGGWGVKQWG